MTSASSCRSRGFSNRLIVGNRGMVRKRGFEPEGRARSAKAERLKRSEAQSERERMMVRKRGFEPPLDCSN